MPMAARLGDLTSHGTPLAPGVGSVNVLIGGKPAWRAVADFHACPLVTGLVPHVGGVVAIGSVTVLINNLPAARQGDQVVEVGPPNAIALGEPTVMIGG
ncbi:MAG: PAAR domain-containing protein [Blastocatellia bacterium]